MTFTLLQLNINGDNFWHKLIPYLLTSNFDFLMLQELTGENTISGNINSKLDCYKELQKLLAFEYNSELAISNQYTSSDTSYLGNAIFYKKQFPLISKNILTLHKPLNPIPSAAESYEDVGRNVLHLQLGINNIPFSFLTAHLAWAKTSEEHPHQTQQGEILLEYLKKVPSPFIFAGDFNLDPEQPLIKKINVLAHNLTTENKITNTLNPNFHRIKKLFPPGLAVDYIFVSEGISVKEFSVVEKNLSDHLGLMAKIEV